MKNITVLFKNLLLVCLIFASSQLSGQEEIEFKDTYIVYLKNGSIFSGKIDAYQIGKSLTLRINSKSVLTFDDVDIEKIVRDQKEEKPKEIREYAFREKGLYYVATLGYIGGNNQFGGYTSGFNAHFKTGYQLKRLIGVGLGTGIDFYNINLGSVIPVYGEIRGYLKAANMSPFYSLATGIGFPIKNKNSSFTSSKFGYYFAPTLGLRLGGSSEANMTLALGLQWQKATYTQDFRNDTIIQIEDTYINKRFNFSIGVVF